MGERSSTGMGSLLELPDLMLTVMPFSGEPKAYRLGIVAANGLISQDSCVAVRRRRRGG